MPRAAEGVARGRRGRCTHPLGSHSSLRSECLVTYRGRHRPARVPRPCIFYLGLKTQFEADRKCGFGLGCPGVVGGVCVELSGGSFPGCAGLELVLPGLAAEDGPRTLGFEEKYPVQRWMDIYGFRCRFAWVLNISWRSSRSLFPSCCCWRSWTWSWSCCSGWSCGTSACGAS